MKTILFDLDGTLLPMDQDAFTKAYFKALTEKLTPHGYEPDALVKGIWTGTASMVRNDGRRTNEAVFWDAFAAIFGDRVYRDKALFDAFYLAEFDRAKEVCGFDPEANVTVKALKSEGYRIILASNPIFPLTAQKRRMEWAGLNTDDFSYITSYENSSYCKPNPDYYQEILSAIGCSAKDCLMVGNDTTEDMAAEDAGIQTFLLTNCLINSEGKDISSHPHGGFEQLRDYIKHIPKW
jgi:HAD superfamily hydrolase (TIGR01549 family)